MQNRSTVHIYGSDVTKDRDKILNQLSGEVAEMNTPDPSPIVKTYSSIAMIGYDS